MNTLTCGFYKFFPAISRRKKNHNVEIERRVKSKRVDEDAAARISRELDFVLDETAQQTQMFQAKLTRKI